MSRPRIIRSARAWEIALAVAAALAAGAAGGYMIANRAAAPSSTSADQPTAKPDKVTALGRLQPEGGVVPVYGPPGDRIAKLYPAAPGTILKENDPIAELDSKKDRDLEVQVARTQLTEAISARDAAKRAGEQKILTARADLKQAQANQASDLAAVDAKIEYLKLGAATAQAGVKRLDKLRSSGVKVAEEDYEKAKLLAAQAEAELKATEAIRQKTKTTYEEGEKAAKAKLKAAEADLTRMAAIAEVYESDVERLAAWVRAGPVKAEVKNPALPRVLTGVVRSDKDIARMIARNQVFAMGPREDADRRVVQVMVHLDAGGAAEAGRFVGLQVTVTLEPNK